MRRDVREFSVEKRANTRIVTRKGNASRGLERVTSLDYENRELLIPRDVQLSRTLASGRLIDNESEIEIDRRDIGRRESIVLEITRRVKYDFSTLLRRAKFARSRLFLNALSEFDSNLGLQWSVCSGSLSELYSNLAP